MNKKFLSIIIILIALVVLATIIAVCVFKDMFYPTCPKIKPETKKIACVGDSITYGFGVYSTHRRNSFPAILNRLFAGEYDVLNFGLVDRTLMKEADRPYENEKQYAASLDCKADIYLIMLGTNDANPDNWNAKYFESDVLDFINSYKNLSNNSEVIFMTPPEIFAVNGATMENISNDTILLERDIIKKVCAAQNIKVIDVYACTENHPEWFKDGCHPNKEGNKQIANYIYKELTK